MRFRHAHGSALTKPNREAGKTRLGFGPACRTGIFWLAASEAVAATATGSAATVDGWSPIRKPNESPVPRSANTAFEQTGTQRTSAFDGRPITQSDLFSRTKRFTPRFSGVNRTRLSGLIDEDHAHFGCVPTRKSAGPFSHLTHVRRRFNDMKPKRHRLGPTSLVHAIPLRGQG